MTAPHGRRRIAFVAGIAFPWLGPFLLAAVSAARDPITFVAAAAWQMPVLVGAPLLLLAWWKRRISRRSAVYGTAAVLTAPYLAHGVASVVAHDAPGDFAFWGGVSVVMFVVTAILADLIVRAFEEDRPPRSRGEERRA